MVVSLCSERGWLRELGDLEAGDRESVGGIEAMRRADIAFGVAILAIGYNFLPEKGPEGLCWAAAIVLLVIGCWIIFSALSR